MKHLDRKGFIENSAKGLMAASLITMGACTADSEKSMDQRFIHHVFFWLKEPVTGKVKEKFENGIKELVTIETITEKHLGIPASTRRDVIESSYTYSLFVAFRNKADHDIYQEHPTHLKFIKDCEDLWEKVIVYDSVNI